MPPTSLTRAIGSDSRPAGQADRVIDLQAFRDSRQVSHRSVDEEINNRAFDRRLEAFFNRDAGTHVERTSITNPQARRSRHNGNYEVFPDWPDMDYARVITTAESRREAMLDYANQANGSFAQRRRSRGVWDELVSGGSQGDYEALQAHLVREFLAGHRHNTHMAYRRDLNDFLTYCEHRNIRGLDATKATICDYLELLRRSGRSEATVARRLAALRGFYAVAVDEGLLERAPTAHIRSRRPASQTRIRALTQPELVELLAAADRSGSHRLSALAWLLAGTGLRISEACNAQIKDLAHDPAGQLWLTVTCKGDQRRDLPLHPEVAQRIESLIRGRYAGPIFMTRTGRPFDRNNAAVQLRRIAERAGIDGRFSPHVLRHTFVTLARQAGCSLEDVQDAVGHADVATTRRYDRTVLGAANHPAQHILKRSE